MNKQYKNSITDFSIGAYNTKRSKKYLQEILEIILKYVCFTENGKPVHVDGYRYIMDLNDDTATIPINGVTRNE